MKLQDNEKVETKRVRLWRVTPELLVTLSLRSLRSKGGGFPPSIPSTRESGDLWVQSISSWGLRADVSRRTSRRVVDGTWVLTQKGSQGRLEDPRPFSLVPTSTQDVGLRTPVVTRRGVECKSFGRTNMSKGGRLQEVGMSKERNREEGVRRFRCARDFPVYYFNVSRELIFSFPN